MYKRAHLTLVTAVFQRGSDVTKEHAQNVPTAAKMPPGVEQRATQPVPGRMPVGGLQQLRRAQWQSRSGLLLVDGDLDKGADDARQHDGVIGAELHVQTSDFHGGVPLGEPGLPVQLSTIGDDSRRDQGLDPFLVVGVIAKDGRGAAHGPAAEDDGPPTGESGVLAVPQWRVDRHGQQSREPGADTIQNRHAGLWIGYGHVDVHAVDQLFVHKLSRLPLHPAVARGGGHGHRSGAPDRRRSRRENSAAPVLCGRGDRMAQPQEMATHLVHPDTDGGSNLDL